MVWKILHAIIVVNFAIEIAYANYMVFFVMRPPGAPLGPLGAAAMLMDPQKLMVRRMYAFEGWVAISGLCIYLAITEMHPRFWRK